MCVCIFITTMLVLIHNTSASIHQYMHTATHTDKNTRASGAPRVNERPSHDSTCFFVDGFLFHLPSLLLYPRRIRVSFMFAGFLAREIFAGSHTPTHTHPPTHTFIECIYLYSTMCCSFSFVQAAAVTWRPPPSSARPAKSPPQMRSSRRASVVSRRRQSRPQWPPT